MTPFDLVFFPCLSVGCVVSGWIACAAAGRSSRSAALVLLMVAIAVLWFAIVAGVHYGFGAWQGMDNPPDEAFADGAQLTGSLLFGWVPAAVFCLLVFRGARSLGARRAARQSH